MTTATTTPDELRALLANRAVRNRLVLQVLPINNDLASKVRFCSAVGEFACIRDKVEKKQKGRKIVGTFVENGSLFGMQNLPVDLARELTTSAAADTTTNMEDKLAQLELVVLQELGQSEIVRDFAAAARDEVRSTPHPPQGLKRVPSKLEVWSNEFYDTVISPVLSPLLRTTSPAAGAGTLKKGAMAAMEELVLNDEERELEMVLEDRASAHRLICKLAASGAQLSVSARLCSSVLEYDKISERRYGVEKRAKARKIVAVFVQPGSLFCVKNLPRELVDAVIAADDNPAATTTHLHAAKRFLYGELLKDQLVRNEIRDILNNNA